jgi:hypothetical protein
MVPTVHEITNEDVAGLLDLAASAYDRVTCAEELKQIEKLAMDIPAYSYRRGDWLDIRFLKEDLFRFVAY